MQKMSHSYREEESRIASHIEPAIASLPLFIGHTEKAVTSDGVMLTTGTCHSIASFAEFEQCFGEAPSDTTLCVNMNHDNQVVSAVCHCHFYLHSCIKQYFDNGGGTCEILSLGNYNEPLHAVTFMMAIKQLPAEATFTLIAMPDAVTLPELPQLQQQLLQYCQQQANCMAILDLPYCDNQTLPATVTAFRHQIGDTALHNGSTFLPWVEVDMPSARHYKHLEIKYTPGAATAWREFQKATRIQSRLFRDHLNHLPNLLLRRMIPPCGTIAGLLYANDQERGVWKLPSAPVNHVHSLSATINDAQQAGLNIDAAQGKSINTLRHFLGRGILLWGGRTLAGNDTEWRYISCKRTFNFLRASIHHYLNNQSFVHNDETTWSQIREACNLFLLKQWRAGALQGEKSKHAFYVRIGINETMSSQDIAEGRLIILAGFALSRPAEFTTLIIKHQLHSQADAVEQARSYPSMANKLKIRARTSPINITINTPLPKQGDGPLPLEIS